MKRQLANRSKSYLNTSLQGFCRCYLLPVCFNYVFHVHDYWWISNSHVHNPKSHVTFPTVFTIIICMVRYSPSLLSTPASIIRQWLESQQMNGQVTCIGSKGTCMGGAVLLGLELHLPCHSQDTGYCTNAHAWLVKHMGYRLWVPVPAL